MEPVAAVVDKFKDFLKSSEDFTMSLFHKREKPNRYNPIEILKRLQREAFSDIMKLRDRQEKVERILLVHKSTKGSPFQELNTHIQGNMDVAGAFLCVDNVDQQTSDTLTRAGMRTGIRSRFTFETTIRQKDSLVAEFSSSDESFGGSLSLAKVIYSANVKDWLSAVIVPCGARCKDVVITSNPLQQEKSLTDISVGPPMLNRHHSSGFGLMLKRANIAAALAGLVSEIESQHCFSTFGQVIYQLSKGTTLSLLGLHRSNSDSEQIRLPKFTFPVRNFLDRGNSTEGSMALVLESELDESSRVGAWMEMQKCGLSWRCFKWGVSMSDTPEEEDEELGWGLSVGGAGSWDQVQAEAFLKFGVGKRCSLQPGVVYVIDGERRVPALMLRSSWSL